MISPTLRLEFLEMNSAKTSVPSITAPPLMLKPIPPPKKNPPKTAISNLSDVMMGKKSKESISAKPAIAKMVLTAKVLDICFKPSKTKGILTKITNKPKPKPVLMFNKSEIPIAPPSKKLLGNKKLLSPKAADVIPKRIKIISVIIVAKSAFRYASCTLLFNLIANKYKTPL